MIVRPRRGSGRRWQVTGPGRNGWRLVPLGPDVGSFGGVKPKTVTEARLLEGWVRA
jgi:hypothetical protein